MAGVEEFFCQNLKRDFCALELVLEIEKRKSSQFDL